MNDPRAVQLLLSLGTGRNLEPDNHQGTGWGLYYNYVNSAAKWATQSQGTHHTMEYFTQGVADYYRLNVKKGLGKMKLDECKGERGEKTLRYIRAKTEEYLQSQNVRDMITAAAHRLVNIRRARSGQLDRDRWERFCHGVTYACPVEPCHQGRKRHRERRDLHRHMQDDHKDSHLSDLESLLNSGKRFPNDDVDRGRRTPSP